MNAGSGGLNAEYDVLTEAEKPGPSCPECGHLIGVHSHDAGCMDSMTDGRLDRDRLGFCPCIRTSVDLIAALVALPLVNPDGETQTILARPDLQAVGIYGNCLQAALATVLRRPLASVPHVGLFSLWEHAMRLWLRGEDLDYTVVKGPEIPQERALLIGQSPRGYAHAVVSEGGRIVWDPHPSRDGLSTVAAAYVIHEWDGTGDDLYRPAGAVTTVAENAETAELPCWRGCPLDVASGLRKHQWPCDFDGQTDALNRPAEGGGDRD